MNRNFKSLIYFSLLLFVGLLVSFQSFSIYKLNRKVAELESTDQSLAVGHIPDPVVVDPWNSVANAYDPFTSMRQMQQRMDHLFDSVFQLNGPGFSGSADITASGPAIEVNETNENFEIEIAIPPDSEIELSTEVEDDLVRLIGSVNYQGNSSGSNLTSFYSSRSQFSRSIPLRKPVDPLGLITDQQDDRIVITVPKA